MSELEEMTRTQVAVDGERFFLARGQDPEELKRRFEAAAMAPSGTFVEFVAVGERIVSVLVSPATRVVVTVETVTVDPQGPDDEGAPFEGLFDF